ncbi:unnamed protein product [Ostreobium quekettii]|uniref:dCMP deaminase n=1 Tax=Ostreobium quekettii TaxID=121088 RepID=A0A8S1JB59_9CHLO|nr:unnamed protein product [Ostreobium quekettii]|eukprot:evm.model.scf_682EXC.8 EVM.evm.TU.scf_682EXC.8   scf_682EXC:42059-46065(-)
MLLSWCLLVGSTAVVLKAVEAVLANVLASRKGTPKPPEGPGEMRPMVDPWDPSPRDGFLTWDDYFMALAFLSAQRSKDPNRQVGACIVNQENVILGIGYNGFPRGCSDHQLPWAKKSRCGDPLGTKYPYVVHAEANAILNKNAASVSGAKIYVTLFPCNECAKLIIQAGIKEVVFHEDKAEGRAVDPTYSASKQMLKMVGVKLRQHSPGKTVTLRL